MNLWKSIRRGWDHFSPFLSYIVGDGHKVRFWHDLWCCDSPLEVTYLELYANSGNRDNFVAMLMSVDSGVLHWDKDHLRNINHWEMEPMASFIELIYSISLEGLRDDRLCWLRNEKRDFSVKSFYRCLSPSLSLPFPWKGIWKLKVPPRVVFFMWTAALGKVLIAENLRKRNIIIISWCNTCKKGWGNYRPPAPSLFGGKGAMI